MGATTEIHSVDHTPLLTAPQLVVEILLKAARETLSSTI